MKIGEIAKKAGVGVETVRYYERQHIIRQPLRPTGGGFRAYPPEIVSQIRFIRRAQDLGFSLKEVEELLSLKTDPSVDCGEIQARATKKRREVNEKIEDLRQIRNALDAVIDACPGGGSLKACSIIEEMENG